MIKAHAGVDGCHKPVAIGRPVECVKMTEFAVGVLLRFPGLEIVDDQSLGGEVRVAEFLELALHVRDLGAVGTPAGFSAVRRNLKAITAVAVHAIDVANLGRALTFVGDEANLGAVW